MEQELIYTISQIKKYISKFKMTIKTQKIIVVKKEN